MPRLAPLAALLACAVALSGCVKIEGQTEEQLDTIGPVRVTTTVCVSAQDNDPAATCKANGTNTDLEAQTGGGGQLLVAYRIPTAAVAPATVSASYLAPASGSTTLERSDSYSSEMQAKAPPVAGERWVGYLSPVIAQADQEPDARARIVAEFGLGRGSDGAPFAGPVSYRVVAGVRGATTPAEAARAVVCNDDVTKNTPNEAMFCVDSPKGGEAVIAGDDRSLPTKDLGVLDGPTATVRPGAAATLPFTIRSVALNGSPVFNLSAGTTVPGGGASTAQSVFAPTPGDTTVPVSIGVPATTPPGTYDVTLSASTGSQLRTGHGTLTVLGKPALTVALGKKPKLRRALRRGLPVSVACDGPCSIKVRLGRFGGGAGNLDASGTTKVLATFKKGVRRKRAKAAKLAFRLVVTATGPGGKTVKTKRVRLRR